METKKKGLEKRPPKNPLGKDPEKKIDSFTIRYKGKMQLNKIYDTIKEWFKENNFEYNEDIYESEKDQREINLSAEMIKNNFKSKMDIYLKFYGNFGVSMVKDKKYPEIDEGKIEIKIHKGKAELIKEDIYGDNPWIKGTINTTKKLIWRTYAKLLDQDLENEKRHLRKKVVELHSILKKTIGMTAQ